jgi:short-subunit dehydrogenase
MQQKAAVAAETGVNRLAVTRRKGHRPGDEGTIAESNPDHRRLERPGSGAGTVLCPTGPQLVAVGRDRQRLDSVAIDCRTAGADVTVCSLDIVDSAAAIAAIEGENDAGAIGLALLVAGMGDTRAPGDLVEDAAQVARLGLVNFVATTSMAAALARRMTRRREGRIVIVGSAAAFHALPFAGTYAGSKAGIARFAQALRLGVKQYGVHVTLVSPGFIDTRSGRKAPGVRPFLLQPSDAAARIARASARGRAHAIFPWPFVLLRWVDRLLPPLLPPMLRDRLLLGLIPPGD